MASIQPFIDVESWQAPTHLGRIHLCAVPDHVAILLDPSEARQIIDVLTAALVELDQGTR